MRYRVVRPHQKISKPLLLLIFGLVVMGWEVACTPTSAGEPSARTQPYTFYLNAWTEDNPENRLVPLDPETLDDRLNRRTMELGRTWRLSPDGSTLVNVEYRRGNIPDLEPPQLEPDDLWLVVVDLQTGIERFRFHPPATVFPRALSQDGSRLLLAPLGEAEPADWTIVDTSNGRQMARVKDDGRSCGKVLFDPALRQRLYCQVEPALTDSLKQEPIRIIAYDVSRGVKAGELELPGVLAGGRWESDQIRGNRPTRLFLDPAIAMSPDGQRLAVVHAEADKITLIDAPNLSVEKTLSLERPKNLWDWLGFAATVVHAKSEMQGTIRHATFSLDGQTLYVFSQEVWIVSEDAPAERGLWLVDLEKGSIVAEALPEYQIQWVRPAPDGTVFVFGTTDERLLPYEIRSTSPSMLWRLDGLTLEILSGRKFTGYRRGQLVISPSTPVVDKAAAMASHETASIYEQHLDCPVTQPPDPPFIPADPWPSQPPEKGQFWYGDSRLWTALPTNGSWRQLALGEKFWWWSEEFEELDVFEDDTPDLTVTARRLDVDAPPFRVTEATNGYHESFHWAMLIGVELASPGCWEFTGQYKGHRLSLVLWVPPE